MSKADAWWDDLISDERAARSVMQSPVVAVATGGPSEEGPTRMRVPRIRDMIGSVLRLLPLPGTRRGRRQRHERRRLSAVALIAIVLLTGSICSVGVIMLNNVVIKRSAELGRLETERRTLRTENALLAADIAKLSAPPRIAQIARKKLGMTAPASIASFMYIDESHKPVSDEWKRRKAEQLRNQVAADQEQAAAKISGAEATQ